jgi:hypothetical protein
MHSAERTAIALVVRRVIHTRQIATQEVRPLNRTPRAGTEGRRSRAITVLCLRYAIRQSGVDSRSPGQSAGRRRDEEIQGTLARLQIGVLQAFDFEARLPDQRRDISVQRASAEQSLRKAIQTLLVHEDIEQVSRGRKF